MNDPDHEYTHHVNVTEIYLESAAPTSEEQYLLDGYQYILDKYLAQHPEGESAYGKPAAGEDTPFDSQGFIIGGDFESLGSLLDEVVAAGPINSGIEALDVWYDILSNPTTMLESHWQVMGEAYLTSEPDGNHRVRLTQTAQTHIEQLVALDSQARTLRLDVEVVDARADDRLIVSFRDQILKEFPLQAGTNATYYVDVESLRGQAGDIRFSLSGPESEPLDVVLDNISISSELPPTMANPDRAFSLAGQAVVVDVLANDQDPSGVLLPSSVLVTSGPEHGSAAVDPLTGHITYTPTADFSGEDSLTYQAGDGDSTTVTAQLTIYVGRPAILSVLDEAIESDHQLVIQFSQPMDRGSVETISSYQVSRTPAATVLPIESARYQEVDGRFQVVLSLPAQAIDAGRYNVQAATTHLRNEGGFAIDVSASRLFVNDSQANALLELSLQDVNNGLPEFALSRSTSFGHGLPTKVFGGDMTADGVDDLLVIHEGSAQLLLYAGASLAGTFEPPQTIPSEVVPASLATADWNGDGRTDIVVAGFSQAAGGNLIEVLLGQGDGTFTAAPDTPIRSGLDGVGQLVVRDFDRDGTY